MGYFSELLSNTDNSMVSLDNGMVTPNNAIGLPNNDIVYLINSIISRKYAMVFLDNSIVHIIMIWFYLTML